MEETEARRYGWGRLSTPLSSAGPVFVVRRMTLLRLRPGIAALPISAAPRPKNTCKISNSTAFLCRVRPALNSISRPRSHDLEFEMYTGLTRIPFENAVADLSRLLRGWCGCSDQGSVMEAGHVIWPAILKVRTEQQPILRLTFIRSPPTQHQT
jgi:hypothetical protein